MPSAIGTALIEVVVAALLVVVVLVLVLTEAMVVVVVVVAATEAEAAKELAVAVVCVVSASGSIVAITQLFVSDLFAITCRVAFTNVMSFAHLSSAQYSNCHPCIEH